MTTKTMETQNFKVVSSESEINWTGRKVTGAHNGTIDIKAGSLHVTDGKLNAGSFSIDTTSIKILDISDRATNTQFAGHLFSEDFFATDRFPEATFEISDVAQTGSSSQITGNLTIKGITHSVSFPADVNITRESITASGKVLVDRTSYDMKFRSGNFFLNLGDTLIYNDFELDVKLTAIATN
jgi:polyisoprenoid-binding protein YceI